MVTKEATKCAAVAALAALAVILPGPARAYGPYEEFGRQDSIKAMLYLHLPLGQTVSGVARKATFGLLVRTEFSPAHPAYERGRGPYVDSSAIGIGVIDLHLGMHGKGSGIDVVGWTMFGNTGDGN